MVCFEKIGLLRYELQKAPISTNVSTSFCASPRSNSKVWLTLSLELKTQVKIFVSITYITYIFLFQSLPVRVISSKQLIFCTLKLPKNITSLIKYSNYLPHLVEISLKNAGFQITSLKCASFHGENNTKKFSICYLVYDTY